MQNHSHKNEAAFQGVAFMKENYKLTSKSKSPKIARLY